MATSLEIEISQLLKSIGEPALVADELLKKWSRGELSDDDVETVSHFLISFGFLSALSENLATRARDRKRLPWGAVVRLIERAVEKPKKETLDQIFIGAGEQGGLDRISRTTRLDLIDARFAKMRAEFATQRRIDFQKQRQKLIDKAIFYKNDRRYDKEASTLEHLLKLFPNDYELKEMLSEIASRNAIDKLGQLKREQAREILEPREEPLPPELQKAADEISKKLIAKADKSPAQAYNIAMSLYLMGLKEEALRALKKSKDSYEVDWFKIDLMLETRRFLDVLSSIDSLEKKYASQPEISFAAMLTRAQALWGLRKKESAIEILEDIVRVKPDYRSAHALLMQWKSGQR